MKIRFIQSCICGMLLFSASYAKAQLSVNVSVQYNGCQKSILTANVTGGTGNYSYAWGVLPNSSCYVSANRSKYQIELDLCAYAATYYVVVRDLITGELQYAEVVVSNSWPFGQISADIPNVFTPNGDGVNDTFNLCTANLGSGPVNAYRVKCVIFNRWGAKVYENTYTNYSGIIAPFPLWNGGSNSAGNYYAELDIENCTETKSIKGNVLIIR